MPYRIRRSESVEVGVKRIAKEQIRRTITEIHDSTLDMQKTVHQVRKRCKKIRGLIRLVRPEFDHYRPESTFFRDLAREISVVRDAQAMLETMDALINYFGDQLEPTAFIPIRERLIHRRDELADDQSLSHRVDMILVRMQAALQRVDGWSIDEKGFDALVGGLSKTYRRGRIALTDAYLECTNEHFHEWRKRTKYHRYHTRLLRSIWKPLMSEHRDAASELSDYLGEDHDLSILSATLTENLDQLGDVPELQVLIGLIDSRHQQLRAQSRLLGLRLFAEKPKHLVRRFRHYWSTWRDKYDASSLLPHGLTQVVAHE